jgi:hypothetical protein
MAVPVRADSPVPPELQGFGLVGGRETPYDDSRYSRAVGNLNPYHNWSYGYARGPIYIDKTFTAKQHQLIAQAAHQVGMRMKNPRIQAELAQCAAQNSSKEGPRSLAKFNEQVSYYFTHGPFRTYVYITAFSGTSPKPGNSLPFIGLGWTGSISSVPKGKATDASGPYDILHIAINRDFVPEDNSRDNIVLFAETIAHEFLHNLGFTHNSGYAGTYIEAYEQCMGNDIRSRGLL